MSRKRREVPWLDLRNETYNVCWYDSEAKRTKRLSLSTADPVEAQRRFAEYLTKGHSLFRDAGPSGLTVNDALDDYGREHVTQHVVDKRRQEDAIRHLKAWFKNTLLIDVDIPASRAYADARRTGVVGGGRRRKDGTGSDSTIRRELVVLQAAANHAARWRRVGPAAIPPTAMPSIEMPHEVRVESIGEDEWLTKDEFNLALSRATGLLRDFILIAYDTASRREAVERLTRFQIDLKNGRVNLRHPGETDNQRRSNKRRPVVPIGPRARPVYERLLAATNSEWLFGEPRNWYRPFRRHMEAIGLSHKRNPHILRHSRATHLLQDGVTIYDVARLLGDTVATVERVYGHHSPEYLAEAIREREA
jgi:integrase